MTDRIEAGAAQAAMWGGNAAAAWVASQALLDRLFKPFEDRVVGGLLTGMRVIDVGCGPGTTTLAAARQVGEGGHALGVDVSEPMLQAARARASEAGLPAEFVTGDAATMAFRPGTFDAIISRFGTMFFGDFAAAFGNLRGGLRPGGSLSIITWRTPKENPFMIAAEEAARPLLPDLPERRAGEPGQFGLAEAHAIEAMLKASGWADIAIAPLDEPCRLSADEFENYIATMGPVGRALAEVDADLAARVIAAVRPAFDRFRDGDAVEFNAACWHVTARSPD